MFGQGKRMESLDARAREHLGGCLKLAGAAMLGPPLCVAVILAWQSMLNEEYGLLLALALIPGCIVASGVMACLGISLLRKARAERRAALAVDEFLQCELIDALEKISIPDLGLRKFHVKQGGKSQLFGRLLYLNSEGFSFPLWVGLNVNRIFVIYFFPIETDSSLQAIRDVFRFTLNRARKIGFHTSTLEVTIKEEKVAAIWLTMENIGGLVASQSNKAFRAHDIALMTESLLRTGSRAKLSLCNKAILSGPG